MRLHQGQATFQRDGRERILNVRVTGNPGRADQGSVITLDDISDLVTAQRTAAWADVARRIAHEIKNPLTPIQLSAERLKRRYGRHIVEGRDVFDQCTDTIIRQVDDIKRMVDEFSSFARMPKARPARDDLADCVRQGLFLMRVGRPDIAFEDRLPAEAVFAKFDRRLISQALTNVVKNAAEGIDALRGRRRERGAFSSPCRLTAATLPDPVSDNGKGFPSEDRHRLIEPYVTTRAEGTGLGLPIVIKIFEDHGGRRRTARRTAAEDGGHGAKVLMTTAAASAKRAGPGAPAENEQEWIVLMATDILIVDDEDDIREIVSGILADEGHGTRLARNSDEALAAIEARRPQLILLDIWLQGSRLDGLQLLEIVKRQHPNVPVVMISGHGNIETAVSAIKLGAYDFIEKPFKADRLILIAERALETSRLKREVSELRPAGGAVDRMVGSSAAIDNLRRIIDKLGPANSRVLISGAAGSGKELTARLIHEHSGRADGPFLVINAPTMAPDRMEASCSASRRAPISPAVGALEEAHGGTLYLDEVADMPLETQAKILRVLVDQNFQRVGGARRASTSTCASSPRPAATWRSDHRGALSRGSVSPPFGRADPRFPRWPSGARTFRSSFNFSEEFRQHDGRRAAPRSPPTRWRCCSRMTGRATSANCATTSSGLMILALGDPDAEIIGVDAAGGGRRAGARDPERRRRRETDEPAACARRAKCSSANIWSRRSAGLAEIFRAPPNSSAWSARPCTAS